SRMSRETARATGPVMEAWSAANQAESCTNRTRKFCSVDHALRAPETSLITTNGAVIRQGSAVNVSCRTRNNIRSTLSGTTLVCVISAYLATGCQQLLPAGHRQSSLLAGY